MILFISTPELMVILFITLLIFGANKIPEFARSFGKMMRQLRDATNDIKNEINKSAEQSEINTNFVEDIEKEVNNVKENLQDPLGRIKRDR